MTNDQVGKVVSINAQEHGSTRLQVGKGSENVRDEFAQIGQAVRPCPQHEDRYVCRRQVLLVRQAAVSGGKDIEFGLRLPQQVAVGQTSQPI